MNELLSVVQALSYLNIARGTLYKLIREGGLKTVKVFSRRLIPRSAHDDFLRRKLAEGK